MKKYAQFFLPAFLSSWILLTITVDFIAIPTIFRTLKDVNLGGAIGIELFPKVNFVEVILACGLIICLFYSLSIKTRLFDRFVMVMGFFLALLSIFYFTFLSPEIKTLTLEMSNKMGDFSALPSLSVQHQFYHKLYIKLEGLKLLILVIMLGWSVNLKRNNQI